MKHKRLEFQITWALFAIFVLWWGGLHLFFADNIDHRQLFAASYGIMALWGGIIGLINAKEWGGFKSVMGRLLIVFSVGLLLQEFGQLSYSYFIYFKQIEVPYPSIGDIGYFGSIPLYIYGTVLLGRVIGAGISMKKLRAKLSAVVLPVAMVVFSYLSFLQGYAFEGTPLLTSFLDFGYPVGQAVYVSFAILVYLLSRKMNGGVMKRPLLYILIGLLLQYIADYTFLYQTIQETWAVGGINDFIYLLSYSTLTYGLVNIYYTLSKVRNA